MKKHVLQTIFGDFHSPFTIIEEFSDNLYVDPDTFSH